MSFEPLERCGQLCCSDQIGCDSSDFLIHSQSTHTLIHSPLAKSHPFNATPGPGHLTSQSHSPLHPTLIPNPPTPSPPTSQSSNPHFLNATCCTDQGLVTGTKYIKRGFRTARDVLITYSRRNASQPWHDKLAVACSKCGRLAAACPGRLGVWWLVHGHQASVLWLCWQHPVRGLDPVLTASCAGCACYRFCF